MRTTQYQNRDEWLFARQGKMTGTKLKDCYSKRDPDKRKIGFYALIAERLGVPEETGESAMDRGNRIEEDALDRFAKETGKKVDKSYIMWSRDDNPNIASSPDGVVIEEGTDIVTEAVEVKCLKSSRHIEAYVKKFIENCENFDAVPDEYQMQAVQYFIVNENLKVLHFVFFDPRFLMFRDPETQKANAIDYFEIVVTRDEVEKFIEEYLPFERKVMKQVDDIVNKITF